MNQDNKQILEIVAVDLYEASKTLEMALSAGYEIPWQDIHAIIPNVFLNVAREKVKEEVQENNLKWFGFRTAAESMDALKARMDPEGKLDGLLGDENEK